MYHIIIFLARRYFLDGWSVLAFSESYIIVLAFARIYRICLHGLIIIQQLYSLQEIFSEQISRNCRSPKFFSVRPDSSSNWFRRLTQMDSLQRYINVTKFIIQRSFLNRLYPVFISTYHGKMLFVQRSVSRFIVTWICCD